MSKFASLTAGLLARKGEAEPSSTPFADQLLTRVGAPAVDMRPMIPNTHINKLAHLEHQVEHAPAQPVVPMRPYTVFARRPAQVSPMPAVDDPCDPPMAMPLGPTSLVLHHDEDDAAHARACASCSPTTEDATKTFHVNLRLKRGRFVKLKLSAALLRRPVQDIVGEALDAWFDKLPKDVLGDCACMQRND